MAGGEEGGEGESQTSRCRRGQSLVRQNVCFCSYTARAKCASEKEDEDDTSVDTQSVLAPCCFRQVCSSWTT